MIHPVTFLAAGHGTDVVSALLLVLALLVVGARLAGAVVERLGFPAVLGELMVGVLLGNLVLLGGPDLGPFRDSEAFVVLAELGAVLLLFSVGLESTPRDMMAVGLPALRVAVVGVVTPMALGFGVGALALPGDSWMLHAFLGAMLAATSVGITARVLGDLGALRSRPARIILGAAVIDDVLGLLVLAVIAGIITAAAGGEAMTTAGVLAIVGKAVVFLVGSLLVGGLITPRLFRHTGRLGARGMVQAVALSFCFALSSLALLAGLAPIVGAFAAGLILEDEQHKPHLVPGEKNLHESIEPLIGLLVPVFFVRMGMLVDLRALGWGVLGLGLLLTGAAVLGKLACGLVAPRGVSRLVVGLGMMPRGEVGLIFAGMGAKLLLDGRPVVDTAVYAAAVFMVVATTVATPPLLQWAVRRDVKRGTAPPAAPAAGGDPG
jgi:Kef-type K+ transport system membrane component KefB